MTSCVFKTNLTDIIFEAMAKNDLSFLPLAPTAVLLGGRPQCWDLQTPRDKETSNSSNL